MIKTAGYFYIFGTLIFTVYGQMIIKWRLNRLGSLPELFSDKIRFLFTALFDPIYFQVL